MTPEEWEKVSEIFHQASDLNGDNRTAFLEKACAGNDSLLHEVESLLKANTDAEDFISEPVVGAFTAGIFDESEPKPGEFLGSYRIEKKIGTGGMGKVFLATDTKLGRPAAIKTLSAAFEADENFIRRFEREARAAATLNHPNVATVYTVEEQDGKPYIAMEYIDGKPLDALIPPNGVDLDTFFWWFVPVADALASAHERKLIHRDIKPGNVMITSDGNPKVLDFGLACFDHDGTSKADSRTDLTNPGQIIGTPSYMSPEQAEGKRIDFRSDIFSLGVVMYQALTGKRPFAGESHAEVISNLLKTEPPSVSTVRQDVPSVIAKTIEKCLAKSRGARFSSTRDLRNILESARPLARSDEIRDSSIRRFYREMTSNPTKWWVAAAILVPILAIAGWYFFSSGRSEPPVNFATMTMRRLSDTNNVGFSLLAPDGKSLVYATFEEEGTRTLWIRRLDDRNALQLVPPQIWAYWGGLAISEDGGQVFYLTAARTAAHGSLYRVSSLGGPSRKLVETANDVGGISPDGQRILFVRYTEPSQIVAVNTSDGGSEQVILSATDHPLQTNFRDPQFSPDGKSVYFIRTQRIDGIEYWSLEVISLDDGHVKQILKQRERVGELAPLRDSTGVIVTAIDPSTNLQQIYHVSLSDGKMTRITNDLTFYFGVSVDREGRNIVSSQRHDEQRVWVGDANNLQGLKPLNQEPNAHRNVDWTPDGRIVYDAYENNRTDIWIADADGKNLQRLTSSDSDDSEPRVSGDGRYIVFTSTRAGFNQVWRMNIDGGNQVLLADVPGQTQTPRFAADGTTVVFNWLRERDRILGKVPVTGGNVETMQEFEGIPVFSAYYWAMAPDGKYVAYSFTDKADGQTKVAVRPPEAVEPTTILDIWPSLVFKWMPDSQSILYRERQLGYLPENEIRKVDIATGKPKVLLSVAPEYIVDLSYSRDGKKAAVMRGKGSSNSIILTTAPAK